MDWIELTLAAAYFITLLAFIIMANAWLEALVAVIIFWGVIKCLR
jgi:hypothetical protein